MSDEQQPGQGWRALLWASVGDLIGRVVRVVRLEGEMDAGADLTAERDAALRERDAAKEECERLRASVAELEAAAKLAPAANAGGEANQPQPPRGWLTEEERDAVNECLRSVREEMDLLKRWRPAHRFVDEWRRKEAVLSALLARETPPSVKVPSRHVIITTVDARERIDRQWIAAIRAAGGEVEE